MFYRGQHRDAIRELRDKLAEVLARDDTINGQGVEAAQRKIVVTADEEVRQAFERLLDCCNAALRV